MSRQAFLIGLVGKRYESGAEGPERFDCFGLAAYVLRTLFDTDLPRDGASILAARRIWRPAFRPSDGSIVVMRDGDKHVGIWLVENGGGVLHATQRRGVVFDSPLGLRKSGFGVPRFFSRRIEDVGRFHPERVRQSP